MNVYVKLQTKDASVSFDFSKLLLIISDDYHDKNQ